MLMNNPVSSRTGALGVAGVLLFALVHRGQAQDWPQWRGLNRDARVTGFQAPKTWPKALAQKWKVTVGEGVATPALAGGKFYVFSREEGTEVTRCLDAATGKELWKESYDSLGATGPAQGFSGPRSSPVVSAGKVVTVGVRGVVSCLDAANGKVLWRKDDFKAWPNFFVSSSPLVVNDLCVAQLGGRDNGAVVAYDLTSGNEKWRWSSSAPSYASPVVMNVGDNQLVVAQTETGMVAIRLADGKRVWAAGAAPAEGPGGPGGPGGPPGGRGGRGGGRDYRATTPAVEGATLIAVGQSATAVKFEPSGDGLNAKELWTNREKPAQFASPVVKDGLVFGLSGANEFFCLDAQTGATLWSATASTGAPAGQPAPAGDRQPPPGGAPGVSGPGGPGGGPGGPGGGAGGPGGGRMRGGMGGGGGGGYGSIVDAGSVLLALTPASELVAFEPSRQGFKEVARIKVADSPTHAYPVVSGNRILIKDRDAVTLWALD